VKDFFSFFFILEKSYNPDFEKSYNPELLESPYIHLRRLNLIDNLLIAHSWTKRKYEERKRKYRDSLEHP